MQPKEHTDRKLRPQSGRGPEFGISRIDTTRTTSPRRLHDEPRKGLRHTVETNRGLLLGLDARTSGTAELSTYRQPSLPGFSIFAEAEYSRTSIAKITLGDFLAHHVNVSSQRNAEVAAGFASIARVLHANANKTVAPLVPVIQALVVNINKTVAPLVPVLKEWQTNIDRFGKSTAMLEVHSLIGDVDRWSVANGSSLQPAPVLNSVPGAVGRLGSETTSVDELMPASDFANSGVRVHPDIVRRLRAAHTSLYRDDDPAGVLMHCRNAIDMALDLDPGKLKKTLRKMGLGRDVQAVIGRLYGFESNNGVHSHVGEAPTFRDAEIVIRITYGIVPYLWEQHGCNAIAERT